MKNSGITAAITSAAVIAAAVIAGCGAGSYGASSTMYHPPAPQPSPTQSGAPLSTANIKGSPGFVTASGFTVYVFDLDLNSPGQSACNGACAQNWPPVVAHTAELPANWSAITRQDNSQQLAYKGRPLYMFAGDSQPGQANGDGLNAFGGFWHVARP